MNELNSYLASGKRFGETDESELELMTNGGVYGCMDEWGPLGW